MKTIQIMGGFLIKSTNTNYVFAVQPLLNRDILFQSDYCHKGMGYNRKSLHSRLCISWKLEKI
jgi:hypothetical protein